jgi:hypothetical protein
LETSPQNILRGKIILADQDSAFGWKDDLHTVSGLSEMFNIPKYKICEYL